jgi:hypothetical protein
MTGQNRASWSDPFCYIRSFVTSDYVTSDYIYIYIYIIDLAIRRSRVQDPAAADSIFLLALGMEIMKYTLENIFYLSYYGVNNNTT